jgi:hypothetical protein
MHLYLLYLLQQWVACRVTFLLFGFYALVIRVIEGVAAMDQPPAYSITHSMGGAYELRLFLLEFVVRSY